MVTMTTRATKKLATCREERKSLLQTAGLPKAPLGVVRAQLGILCERMFASESRQGFADLTDNSEFPPCSGAADGQLCPKRAKPGSKMGLGREEILHSQAGSTLCSRGNGERRGGGGRGGTNLGSRSCPVHSQGDRESTADDVDFEEGSEEVAAAQGQHFLWRCGECPSERTAPFLLRAEAAFCGPAVHPRLFPSSKIWDRLWCSRETWKHNST